MKNIIACADLHIPPYKNIDSLKVVLNNFIEECKTIVKEKTKKNTCIVIAGDIFDSKIAITNESIMAVNWFFSELDKICRTYVIAGNHDMLMNNLNRVDSLTPLFEIGNYKNVFYLDRELEYKSGCYQVDDVVFCVYSSFDNFNVPDIKMFKETHLEENNTYVGIIHGDVNGATSAAGYITENGLDVGIFDECDFVIAGHIHKRQEISSNGVPVVYCSSINQKNFGESVSGHGFVLWSKDEKGEWNYEFKNVSDNNNGYYKFAITDLKDLENDEEDLINY